MSNEHEEAARARKVAALVFALEQRSITATDAAALRDDQRRLVERIAQVNESSPTTWSQVIDALRVREDRRAQLDDQTLSGYEPVDPFELVPTRGTTTRNTRIVKERHTP